MQINGLGCCAICKENIAPGAGVSLTEKGSNGINRASKEREDQVEVEAGDQVHKDCRREFCRPSNIEKEKRKRSHEGLGHTHRPARQSGSQQFDFKTHCLYCGRFIDEEYERKKSRSVYRVTLLDVQDVVRRVCEERADDWAEEVRARILQVHDLPAADAIYHQSCSSNFRTKKQIPSTFSFEQPSTKKQEIGRPQDEATDKAFSDVISYLQENEEDQLTISDLVVKMQEYVDTDSNEAAYSNRYMKTKIEEYFGDDVIITNMHGKANIVTLRRTASSILHDFHLQQKSNLDPEQEKFEIIDAAAKLILSDLKLVSTSIDDYPNIETDVEKHTDFIPSALERFLRILFGKKDDLKIAAIGQAIVQATRPRSILAPLQIGLAIQLHHSFCSRFLVNSLHKLGFCSSYQEVLRHSQNAAVSQGTDLPGYTGGFIQYVADNVDHNLCTLDREGTFHGMGIIATVTPGNKPVSRVPRLKVDVQEILTAGNIEINPPSQPRRASIDVKYKKLSIENIPDPTQNLDILWKISLLFGKTRPGWAGLMQKVHTGAHRGQSSISFLPMIHMSPSDSTCVYSTLTFVLKHSRKYHIAIPIIMFDQPLWYEAYCLVNTEVANTAFKKIEA